MNRRRNDVNKFLSLYENIMSSICACLGPRANEPYCRCEMISRGLKTEADYAMPDAEKERLYKSLQDIFQWRNMMKEVSSKGEDNG